jgi:hypothetical protein
LVAVAVVAAALVPSLSHAAATTTNLALGSVATASSQESSAYPGSLAVDGDATTRWSSAFSDPQTLELSGPVYLRNGASHAGLAGGDRVQQGKLERPVTNDPVTITFGQHIGANDPLRTGTYSASVTFTLSTTHP